MEEDTAVLLVMFSPVANSRSYFSFHGEPDVGTVTDFIKLELGDLAG